MKSLKLWYLAGAGFAFAFLGMTPNAGADDGDDRLNFNLIGTGAMYESTVPDIDGNGVDDPAICFDVQLRDLEDDEDIGTATDCLSNVEDGANGGLALIGTSFFHTDDGTLVTRGATTVQPVNHPTNGFTHITGASAPGNSVLSGTGDFEGATGTVRLSGLVDMTLFAGNVGDPIGFDCIFVIDLDDD